VSPCVYHLATAIKEATLSSNYKSASISLVVVSCNEGKNLRRTVHSLLASLPDGAEIVVVDDGSTDGSADCLTSGYHGVTVLHPDQRLGVACARNFGAKHARGEMVVFSDAHVETPLDWWKPLAAALATTSVGVVAPAITPIGEQGPIGFGMRISGPEMRSYWLGPQGEMAYPVPLLCGCFMAMRRDVVTAVGGFDEGMTTYGSEDLELCLRLWLLGYEVLVTPQVEVAHLFRERHPYHVEWKAYLYNLLRMVFAHSSSERIARVIEVTKGYQDFAAALGLIAQSDIWQRRAILAERRVRDDDWFFHSFGIDC
jgi:GT2 family glycosyltransferase